MSGPDILVVGSINVDLLLFQQRLAARGETLLADGLREEYGGKGANQAVQAARLGKRVGFIGAVGDDERGRASAANLAAEGIGAHLAEVALPTGLGVVNVLAGGEVHATIIRGANEAVTPELLGEHAAVFAGVKFVILQNEIPVEANAAAARLARVAGTQVIYNAAPARELDRAMLADCDWLIVNEEEAAAFLGEHADSPAGMTRAIAGLHEVCPRVIVTLGAAGSVLSTPEGVTVIEAVPVTAVDSTGAGDSYVGAFAAALSDGVPAVTAARIAARIAAMATRSVGAQTSMPRIQDVQDDPVRAQASDP